MERLELNVQGMVCSGCENRIKNALTSLEEVKEVTASHETKKVEIIFKRDVDEEIKTKIKNILTNLDFEVDD